MKLPAMLVLRMLAYFNQDGASVLGLPSLKQPPIEPPTEPERKRPPIRPPNRGPKPEPVKDPPVPPLPGREPKEDPHPIGDPPDQTDQPMRMHRLSTRQFNLSAGFGRGSELQWKNGYNSRQHIRQNSIGI
jgi:hypothetical protein